ncbi:translation initiation factor IF-2 [Oenococcus alcoholitolerans]|uniref:translation initiation factor IF-2 n=1 Tax=Oenococcus alcoholitolerans TaxID=931074 RepID=UPI003F70364F
MTEEEKKRRPLVRHIRKQTASNSELPASRRRHAAGLSNNAQNNRGGSNSNNNKNASSNHRDDTRARRVSRSAESSTGRPMPKDRRPINAGAASAPAETASQQRRPIVRKIRSNDSRRNNSGARNSGFSNSNNNNRNNGSTPRRQHVHNPLPNQHPETNQRRRNNNNHSQTNNRSENNNRNRNAAAVSAHKRPNAAQNGSGRFGGALASGNNSARNNTRRRNQSTTPNNQNRFATGPALGTRRKSGPKGSKKAQRIAAASVRKNRKTERKEQPLPKVLEYRLGMNVQDIAKIIHRDVAEILKKFFLLGVVVNQNQSLDSDAIELLAADYGIEAKQKEEVDVSDIDRFFDEEANDINEDKLTQRPPIVTIMGHVDHGKTTLLDYLRHTHVTEGEAGGITQHIGAYQAKLDGRLITFLDTPGHEAFTEMRARGANVTDITILVVAADDGVMPQTIEAIHHAKAAKTPIIVAINKIDIPGVDPENIVNELMKYDLVPERYGGDTIEVPISAKTGENVDKLLEMILLQADLMELKADPTAKARGSVIEARLDKGRGAVATLLVQQGTLKTGDPIVVGNTFGRVRTMNDASKKSIDGALPATPVEITGLNDVPQAGDHFVIMDSEKEAREAGEQRAKNAMEEERNTGSVVTLDNLFSTMAKNEQKTVPLIVKGDVQGSVEALSDSLMKIKVEGVRVDIIHAAVGAINESDINLAEASDAIIIGFNVRPMGQAKTEAEQKHVDIRLYNVIYDAINEVEAAMKGKLEPVYKEKVLGSVDVRRLFHYSKIGTIVGGIVTDGTITRDSKVRLIRDGVVVYDGVLGSLKHGKDDVKDVKKGFELGLTIANYNDEKVGDVIEPYIMEEVKANA